MRRRLEVLRWTLFAVCVAAIVANWVLEPRGDQAFALFVLMILAGIPAAMLSLHLHPPKFFKHLERR